MPVWPVASVESRSSISARTTSRSTSGPEPAACERTSDRCSWARRSVGMCRVASAPNPVEMPYAGVGAGGELLDDGAGPLDRGLGLGGQRHRGTRPGDGDDVGEGDRAGADRHRVGRGRGTVMAP